MSITHAHDHARTAHDDHGDHIVTVRLNLTIYALLMVLLFLTIAVAYVNLGPFGVPVAMAIATVKAVLILLYFMHVRWSDRLVALFAVATALWLLIMVALTVNDFWSRGWLDVLGK